MLYGGLILLALVSERGTARYSIEETYGGADFFENFEFNSYNDPTHGFVDYQTRDQAFGAGLAYINEKGQAVMRADSETVPNWWSRGRRSVRVTTRKNFPKGLFVFDAEHIPASVCGSWPAYWSNGINRRWPATGEIDIIEYVNKDTRNAGTVHTSPGCEARGDVFNGDLKAKRCGEGGGFRGCGWKDREGKYAGDPVNEAGGAVYVGEWNFETGRPIRLWSFLRDEVPQDITDENPQPWTWKKPFAEWILDDGWCPKDKFTGQRFIINTTFCGDWAGGVWHSGGCAQQTGYNSCNDYVRKNPQVFKNTYWTVNHLKIYQWTDGPQPAPGPPAPAPECRAPVAGRDACVGDIKWAMDTGRRQHPEWYTTFGDYVDGWDQGADINAATSDDFQMYFYCNPYFAGKSQNCGFPACDRKCKGEEEEEVEISEPEPEPTEPATEPPTPTPTEDPTQSPTGCEDWRQQQLQQRRRLAWEELELTDKQKKRVCKWAKTPRACAALDFCKAVMKQDTFKKCKVAK